MMKGSSFTESGQGEAMQKQRVIVVVASALGMFSSLLPWMNAPIVGAMPGTSMPHGGGWIALGVCSVALLGALGRGAMPAWSRLASSCAGLAALGVATWQIVLVVRAKAEMRADGAPLSEAMASAVSIGAGLYLLAAAAIAILVAAFVGHHPMRNTEPESTNEGKEPPWVMGQSSARPIVGERGLAGSALDAAPREHGAVAAKSSRSFFLWLVIGIFGGAGAIYSVLGPPDHSIASEEADASLPMPSLDRCGDLGGFRICVDRVVQRHSLSDVVSTTTAGEDQDFILVRVTLSSAKSRTAELAWPMFELRDGSGRRWEPDVRSQLTASLAGYDTLDFEQLHPGTGIAGWLVYYVPTSAIPSLHLRFKPGLVRSVDVALPDAGDAPCTLGGKAGVCIDVAKCTGIHSAGLCDGPANIQCCVR